MNEVIGKATVFRTYRTRQFVDDDVARHVMTGVLIRMLWRTIRTVMIIGPVKRQRAGQQDEIQPQYDDPADNALGASIPECSKHVHYSMLIRGVQIPYPRNVDQTIVIFTYR